MVAASQHACGLGVCYGTYALSHNGPIQAGAEKLGICGSLRGRLGTFGRGTPVRLLVRELLGRGGETRGGTQAQTC